MSAAELIRAAIGRLEQLQSSTAPGPWVSTASGRQEWAELITGAGDELVCAGDYADSAATLNASDADLIATLHRTIDAQLAVLRAGIAAHSPGDDTTEEIEVLALDLARAILGEDTE